MNREILKDIELLKKEGEITYYDNNNEEILHVFTVRKNSTFLYEKVRNTESGAWCIKEECLRNEAELLEKISEVTL